MWCYLPDTASPSVQAAAYAWRTLANAIGLGAVDLDAADRDAGTRTTDPVLAARWGATERNDK